MTDMIRLALTALFSYVLAAPFTSRISMDLAQTEWTSLWTYVFWALGIPIALFAAFLTVAGLALAGAGAIAMWEKWS